MKGTSCSRDTIHDHLVSQIDVCLDRRQDFSLSHTHTVSVVCTSKERCVALTTFDDVLSRKKSELNDGCFRLREKQMRIEIFREWTLNLVRKCTGKVPALWRSHRQWRMCNDEH
ncbi:hypothetical protein KP509_32G046200 [Ceratopteris richardii]|uniref:Uncharacterized protein n=1 Tax=Ceratopteris richardii TaxID=49495 RepID=A0A8T2QV91_CERRI|nr:hypothetical protein KP509_32G046200 [Ceratopteris richardii]